MTLILSLPLKASPIQIGELYYTLDPDNLTAAVTNPKAGIGLEKLGYISGDIIIPETISYHGDTYKVTKINPWAFYYCTGLTSVIIPPSITQIETEPFLGCSGLIKAACPDNFNPFSGATGVAIFYPSGSFIEDGIIYGPNKSSIYYVPWEATGEFIIPKTVEYIGRDAFSQCVYLNNVNLSNSVKTIEDQAFYGCTSLEKINMPESLEKIGKLAFFKCERIIEIVIPNSVSTVEYFSFARCNNLQKVVLPDKIVKIENSAFRECGNLSDINFPMSLNEIEAEAFYNCFSLSNVVIPNKVSSIGKDAFYGCTGLIRSAYPDNISWNPFVNKGRSIMYPSEGAIFEDGFVYGPEKQALYFAPLDLEGEHIIHDSVVEIHEYAFYHCKKLTGVIIPSSVITVGSNAFSECSGLIRSAYPGSILFNPFSNGIVIRYSNPEHVVFENGFIYGPDKKDILFAPLALEGILILPESVERICENAFSQCKFLNEIDFPNSVTVIEESAFDGCANLREIKFSDSIYLLGENAFRKCLAINSISLPESLKLIEKNCFSQCEGLTQITFNSKGITEIEENAFQGCNAIKQIFCKTDVTPFSISFNVFENFIYSVTSLWIPARDLTRYSNTTPWSKFLNIFTLPESDGIKNIEESSNITIIVYSIDGRTILNSTSPEDLQTLHPGLYFVNGEKIMVK